jgi:flavodoxin I
MKAMVVYDSVHGNTEAVAKAIGGALSVEAEVVRASDAAPTELGMLDLLIVGAPTYGGRPTPPVREFLAKVERGALAGLRVAAFDTRMPARWVRIFGFAAGKIARRLTRLGGSLAAPAEGFYVEGAEGPLVQGEQERAAAWAKGLLEDRG